MHRRRAKDVIVFVFSCATTIAASRRSPAHAIRRDAARLATAAIIRAPRVALHSGRTRRRLAATFSDGQLRDLQLALSFSHRSFSPSLARIDRSKCSARDARPRLIPLAGNAGACVSLHFKLNYTRTPSLRCSPYPHLLPFAYPCSPCSASFVIDLVFRPLSSAR